MVWTDVPLLPLPDSLDNPHSEADNESWGASLRSSVMSAISVVTGHRSSISDAPRNNPARVHSHSFRTRWAQGIRRDVRSVASSFDSAESQGEIVQKDVGCEIAYGLGIKLDPASKSVESFDRNISGLPYETVPPLVIHKKSLQPRKKYRLSDPGFASISPSRASSVSSRSVSCTASNHPSTDVNAASGARLHSQRQATGLGTSQRVKKSATTQIASRPTFLKRGTSSGYSSAASSSSGEMDSDIALAKRAMMMRERRKKSLEMGWSDLRNANMSGSFSNRGSRKLGL